MPKSQGLTGLSIRDTLTTDIDFQPPPVLETPLWFALSVVAGFAWLVVENRTATGDVPESRWNMDVVSRAIKGINAAMRCWISRLGDRETATTEGEMRIRLVFS
jgi:hypothetical protein